MVSGEREMVQELQRPEGEREERFTSLQPTYEDSVPPKADDDWDEDE